MSVDGDGELETDLVGVEELVDDEEEVDVGRRGVDELFRRVRVGVDARDARARVGAVGDEVERGVGGATDLVDRDGERLPSRRDTV